MIDKIVQSVAEAMAGIKDGSTVLIGGFGAVGQPNALIDGLIEQGATDLTVACNNAGVGHIGLARLMELGRVRKIICSATSSPKGQRRNTTSFITSTKMPPRPNIAIGPNTGSR